MVEELGWQKGDSLIVGKIRDRKELVLQKSPQNWYERVPPDVP
jgi:hypothetical protein